MNLFEVSWRSTQQIAIVDDGNDIKDKIDGWGSGVFIHYKGRLIFVTADHVVHYDDHSDSNETGQRLDKDDKIYIITNVTDSSNQVGFQQIGGIYSFDEYCLPDLEECSNDDIEVASIPDMKDFAFSFIDATNTFKIVTHALLDNDSSIIVNKDLSKICIREENFNCGSPSGYCIVTGTVKNKIVQVEDDNHNMKNQINRRNAIHLDLSYSGNNNFDGDYIFNYPERVYNSLWAGLSGAPVIDENGKLVGLVVRAVADNNTIIVKPISEILRFISIAIDIETKNIT